MKRPVFQTPSATAKPAATILLIGALSFFSTFSFAENNFSFVALGDTAYKESRRPEYSQLIQTINKSKPSFSIHIGDTIGHQPCTTSAYENIATSFKEFDHPLVYTPGDNEWADCWDKSVKQKSPKYHQAQTDIKLDSLKRIRNLFFSKPKSLGKTPISLTRQSDVSPYKKYVENAYWEHNGVLFVSVHVVGSNDGLSPTLPDIAKESIARREANIAWLNMIMDKVKKEQPKALVLVMHAELFTKESTRQSMNEWSNLTIRGGSHGPYAAIAQRIAKLSKVYERPILLIHGDHHRFTIDRPFHLHRGEAKPNKQKGENVTRLQVFGSPDLKAVKVTVEPDTPWVFGFSPLF